MSSPPAAQEPRRASIAGVRAPKPLLSPENERRLSDRQRELLDELGTADGLGELTMSEIAARMNCSLRTLYGIAPSKEELVLTVVDRRLHRTGRSSIGSLDASLSPLEKLRAYLRAANRAVQPEAVSFARELAGIPGAGRLLDAHEGYVIAVAQSLLDRAVEQAEIAPVDTASVAHVLGGLGREFSRPEVAELASAPAKATADAITDIILRGLEREG